MSNDDEFYVKNNKLIVKSIKVIYIITTLMYIINSIIMLNNLQRYEIAMLVQSVLIIIQSVTLIYFYYNSSIHGLYGMSNRDNNAKLAIDMKRLNYLMMPITLVIISFHLIMIGYLA